MEKQLARREARFYVGLLALFALAIGTWLALMAIVPAAVLGWETVAVTSGSMQPSIEPGDVVVAEPYDGRTLAKGDVVVFEDAAGRGLVTHRVARSYPDGTYLTGGDANRVFDSTPLKPAQIRGVGRLLVPAAGVPAMLLAEGDGGRLAAFGIAAVVCVWLARFGLLDRYCPWIEVDDVGEQPPSASSWSPATAIELAPCRASGSSEPRAV